MTIDPGYRTFCALMELFLSTDSAKRNDIKFRHSIQNELRSRTEEVAKKISSQGTWSAAFGIISGIASVSSGFAGPLFDLSEKASESFSKTLGTVSQVSDAAKNSVNLFQEGWKYTAQASVDEMRENMNLENRSIEDRNQFAHLILNSMERLAQSVKESNIIR